VLHWITRVLAVLVLAIACMKLVEFLGGFHFEIDAWFVRNPGMFGAVPTGRMAPMTALNFVFLAGGLLALSGDGCRRWAGALGALATIIATVILVGYYYGTPLLYGGTQSGNVFSQEQLHSTVNRHAALTPEAFFTRVLNDIRHFSKHDAFNDDVCVVGVQVQHTG
jgi:hypothetical protein